MKRYDLLQEYGWGEMIEGVDGEWVRYSDHVEAMKRIAGSEQSLASTAIAILAQSAPTESLQGTQGEASTADWLSGKSVIANYSPPPAGPVAHAAPACPHCHGEGLDGDPGDEPGTGYMWKCEDCDGTGRVQYRTVPVNPAPEMVDAAYIHPERMPASAKKSMADCLRRAILAAPAPTQGTQEPVAWTRTDTITDAAGYAIGLDEPEVQWGSERPDGDVWYPLYDRPISRLPITEHDAESLQMIAGWMDRDGIPEAADPLRRLAAPAPVGCETRDLAKQGAAPVYDQSVVKRIATQMGWTPPSASPALTGERATDALRMARAAMTTNGLTARELPRVFEIIDAALAASQADKEKK